MMPRIDEVLVPIQRDLFGLGALLATPDHEKMQRQLEKARIDDERMQFTGLKMTTYNVETNTPALAIDMPTSTLNLTTRVISSHDRTTVTRADFTIAGDTMRFDTVAREGRLVGNVKMVISDKSQLTGNTGQ
jgi:hypothetical protein